MILKIVYKKFQKIEILFFLIILALIFFRDISFFFQPRIWAEEGTVHLSSVVSNGYFQSLFIPHLGYFSFFNNFIASVGLYLGGLSNVAYFTTLASALVTLIVVLSPFYLPSEYWRSNREKFLISTFSLLIGSAEIWMNTINAQFFFGLFSCMLYMSNVDKIKSGIFWGIVFILINAVLTGVTSVILLPFFIFRYILSSTRSIRERVIFYCLAFGFFVQVLSLILSKPTTLGRLSLENFVNFPYGVFNNLISFLRLVETENSYPKAAILFLLMFLLLFSKRRAFVAVPLLMALYISVVFAFLALGMHGGGRYGYIPSVLIFVYLLNVDLSHIRLLNSLKIMSAVFLVCICAPGFFQTERYYQADWITFSPDNARELSPGVLEMKLFPQWNGTNWRLVISSEDFERLR